MKLNTSQKIRKIFIIFFVFSLSLISSFILIEEFLYGNKAQEVALDNGIKKTLERKDILESFLSSATEHLITIRQSNFFTDYLNNPQKQNELLEQMLLIYSQSNKNFMQLRYIDKNGFEKIRIDRKTPNKQPYLIVKEYLQNKSNRYYFQNSKTKELEKVWFSAIDLNRENGKVETPFNPTFRAILPIKHQSQFNGILIINFFMEDFLKNFTNTPLYDMIIYDDKGFTIFHYENGNKSWGNSLKHKYNIVKDFPDQYKKILSSPFLRNDSLVTRKLNLPIYSGLNIALQLKKIYFLKLQEEIQNKYLFVSISTLLLSLLLTFGIIKIFKNQLLNIDILKQLNRELNNSYKQFKKFINTQDNIVILTNGINTQFANQKFYEFFQYKNLNSFLKEHQCICELFLDTSDRFFHLGKIDKDEDWIKGIQKLPDSDRIVMMMGPNFTLHSFSVNINKYSKNQMIISFTDISQTMINQISLESKIVHDKLTKAYNREFFEQNYKKLLSEYHTDVSKLAIALLDIDHFKKVNDTYGHNVGDEVLINFVKTLQTFSRKDDIIIRWGGEEFIIVLRVNSEENLTKALEHLRKVIEIQNFPTVGQKTCSIGGTIYKSGEDIYTTIKRADVGVYKAKQSGRNKVVIK